MGDMTPASQLFFDRVHRRIAGLSPSMQAAILKAFEQVRQSLSDAELIQVIKSGALDKVIDDAMLDRALLPVRSELHHTMELSYLYGVRDLPKAGRIDGVVSVAFNSLSPDVIRAVKALDDRVLATLKTDIKETVRQSVENGLREGRGAASVAREIRSVIGLTPNGEAAVRNFRAALERGDLSKALGYSLRDKRYDGTVKRLLGPNGGGLTPKQMDAMESAYRRKFIANNAGTVARTATFDAYKSAQLLSWKDALAAGVVADGYTLMKQWMHLAGQLHPRPEHEAMDKTIVALGENYPNGDSYAGEHDPWNCHCLDRTFLVRAA